MENDKYKMVNPCVVQVFFVEDEHVKVFVPITIFRPTSQGNVLRTNHR